MQIAHDDVPFWTKQFGIADVAVIQFPETFKANPEPQIPLEQGRFIAQAVVALAPTVAKWYPAAATEHAEADV